MPCRRRGDCVPGRQRGVRRFGEPASAATGAISGIAFKDLNRDGVKQADEEALGGEIVYLLTPDGRYLQNSLTDATGRYQLAGIVDGNYRVAYAKSGAVGGLGPSTTGSPRPQVDVALSGSAVVDFGWRPLVKSSNVSTPLSTFVAPSGLRVESFNDAGTAREVHDLLMPAWSRPKSRFALIIDKPFHNS